MYSNREYVCNRSLNERDIYVFPMLAILVFILFRRKGQRLKLKELSYSKSYIHLPQCEQWQQTLKGKV